MSDEVNRPIYEATLARQVLQDCRFALQELRNDPPRGMRWRVRWVAMMALLRTVRDVLLKVDVKNPAMKQAIREWKKKMRSYPCHVPNAMRHPAIYYQFIHEDSNALLHEYAFSAGQSATIGPGGEIVHDYKMHEGAFAGQDQRDVVQQAIDWLENELSEIAINAAVPAMERTLDDDCDDD